MNNFSVSIPSILLLGLMLLVGCETTTSPEQNHIVDTTADSDTVAPRDTSATALFELTIDNDWSPATHPIGFPLDAHFSHLGGGTHNDQVMFWSEGGLVSDGMRQMAETGHVKILVNQEFDSAIRAGHALTTHYDTNYTPEKPATAPGSRVTSLEISKSHHLVTLVTMLGASPDWFVGVSGLPMMGDGKWLDSIEVDLVLFDGGTKSLRVPEMGGADEASQLPIHKISYDPVSGDYKPATLPHIVGKFTFRRVD